MAEQQEVTRKLSAILSADVKGYSRLMSDDESYTIKVLKDYREILSEIISQHSGRVVDTPGDNLLAEFSSIVNAVESAVEIQNTLKQKNKDIPYDKKLEFRIGINIGDVIQDGDSLYGEGVNIAARIEGLADPGGICISRGAYDHIRNKLKLGYEYIGQHNVKNIKHPVRVYKILMDSKDAGKLIGEKPVQKIKKLYISVAAVFLVVIGVIAAFQYSPTKKVQAPVDSVDLGLAVFPTTDKPSIAVLPFDNMTDDPQQQYFCDGMAEQIITGLSQGPYLYVVSRNSSFAFRGKALTAKEMAEKMNVHYLLEGSVQQNADRIRINVQLIDGRNQNHIWAEHYDRSKEDLFAVQDEITMKILATLNIEVTGFKSANLKNVRPSNLKAYEYFLKGLYFHLGRRPEDIEKARAAFNEAIALDPKFAKAYVLSGLVDMDEIMIRRSKTPEKYLKRAKEMAQKALELDPDNPPYALWNYIYRGEHDYEKAVYYGKKCVEQDPNDPYRYYFLSVAQRFAGEYSDATVSAETALKLTPFRPANFLNNLAWPYLLTKRYPEAITVFEEIIEKSEKSPYGFFAYLGLSAAYEFTGNHGKARWAVENIMQRNPKFTLEDFRRTSKTKDTVEKEMLYSAWRKAGLPESSTPPVPEKPSIAVLPFDNMSGDTEQEYFSDGISEDIITALSKTPKMIVISRKSAFKYKNKSVKVQDIGLDLGARYVLEGSVRKDGEKIRITAQLIDAQTGHHMWAEKYDREKKNVFALQDEITKKVITALQVKLTEGEQARFRSKGTDNLVVYLNVIKARELVRHFNSDDNVKAKQLLEEAIQLDPNYAPAYRWLSSSHYIDTWIGSTKSPQKSLDKAVELSKKALSIDSSLGDSHALLGSIYVKQKEYEKSLPEFEKAVMLYPNGSDTLAIVANQYLYLDKIEEAILLMKKAIDPFPIPPGWALNALAAMYRSNGDYEEALKWSEKAVKEQPRNFISHLNLCSIYSLMGKEEEARQEAEEVLKLKPKFSTGKFEKGLPYKNLEVKKTFMDAVRKAGLPE